MTDVLRRGRASLAFSFFAQGVAFALLVTRIPAIQDRYGVSDALLPVGWIYGKITVLRAKQHWKYRARSRVICVGNLTVGGTGKTPVAIAIAELLAQRNIQPFFLSRGYGGKERGPLVVDVKTHTAKDVGDEPLLRARPLGDLLERQRFEELACLMGTAVVPDPTGFGRILRDSAGRFLRIVEQRDCTPEEAAISEVNPSCYVFEVPGLWDALERLDTGNAQGEYYLTDAPALLQSMNRKVLALPVLQANDILGVNTRQHLAQAHALMQERIHDRLMTEGVSVSPWLLRTTVV